MGNERQNRLFCFVGPGASGKSTICRELLLREPGIELSISTTSRDPREGEKDGREYYFVSEEEFLTRIDQGNFVEHAIFNGRRYGTERPNIERVLQSDKDLVLDIDVQGVEQLKQLYPNQVATIFVFPPSFSMLRERFEKRGTDSEEKIQSRLEIARKEIEKLKVPGFSVYLLLNADLTESFDRAQAIIQAERMRFSRLSPVIPARSRASMNNGLT